MPENGALNLPFFRKRFVYEVFELDVVLFHPEESVPSFGYFILVWKRKCRHINVRKCSWFNQCTQCEQLRNALDNATRKRLPTDYIMPKKRMYNAFIAREG